MKLCPSLPHVLHGVSINSLRIGFPQKRTVVFNSWNLLLSPRSTTFLAKVVKPCVYSLFWHGHPTSIFSWGTEMYVEFDLLVFAPGQCSFTSLILTSFFFFFFQYDLTLTEECRGGVCTGFAFSLTATPHMIWDDELQGPVTSIFPTCASSFSLTALPSPRLPPLSAAFVPV